jgi:hypothetical protein
MNKDTEYWKKHWNTKTTVKELWYPGIDKDYKLTKEREDEIRQEAYEQGWDDACEDIEDCVWGRKYSHP